MVWKYAMVEHYIWAELGMVATVNMCVPWAHMLAALITDNLYIGFLQNLFVAY